MEGLGIPIHSIYSFQDLAFHTNKTLPLDTAPPHALKVWADPAKYSDRTTHQCTFPAIQGLGEWSYRCAETRAIEIVRTIRFNSPLAPKTTQPLKP